MSPSTTPQGDAGRYCAREVRAHDRDRYLCAVTATAVARDALLAVLAFNLEIARSRELVSEPMLGEIRLQWWREGIAGAFAGTPRDHPVLHAIAINAARLSEARLQALIDARSRDLDDELFADVAALGTYLAATAGGLSEAMAAALDAEDAVGLRAASAVGLAWGMIGVLRSVPFNAAQGRVLLPADLLRAEKIETASLLAGSPPPALASVLGILADWAAQRLREARSLRADVSPAVLPALLPATLADQYLVRLARSGFRVFAAPIPAAPLAAPARVIWNAIRNRY